MCIEDRAIDFLKTLNMSFYSLATSIKEAMGSEEIMEMEYSCVIYLNIAEDAIETSCCHQLFC